MYANLSGSDLSQSTAIGDDIFCFESHTKVVLLMERALFQLCNLTSDDEMAAWPMGFQ